VDSEQDEIGIGIALECLDKINKHGMSFPEPVEGNSDNKVA
jgi:hypothetical protein